MKRELINEMNLRIPALSLNEGYARYAVSSFVAQLVQKRTACLSPTVAQGQKTNFSLSFCACCFVRMGNCWLVGESKYISIPFLLKASAISPALKSLCDNISNISLRVGSLKALNTSFIESSSLIFRHLSKYHFFNI